MSERQVQIAHKFYEARNAMRFLYGEKYSAKIAEHQDYIRAQMQKTGTGELKATMQIMQILQAKHPDSGVAQALILSACVEMIEPEQP